MKKLLSFLICTALILSIIPTAVFAAEETSGQCGYNNMWNYNTITATLTISGTGDMYDYGYIGYSPSPWNQYNSNIKNVAIGNNVTSIGWFAFHGFTNLTSITIPNNITSIGRDAFSYCTGLTNITIPDGAISIGACAFWNCTGLTSIIIGKRVADIGDSALGGCINLNSLTVDTKNEKYYSSGNCIIEKDTSKLTLGCKNSTIPWGVVSIGDDAFSYCTGLKA